MQLQPDYLFSYQISYVGRTFQEKVKSDEEGAIADFEKEENKVSVLCKH